MNPMSFSPKARNPACADLSVYFMKTRHLIVLSILVGIGIAPAVLAQALTPPPTNPTAGPTVSTAPAPAAPTASPDTKPQRAVSSNVAASISAGMPKYSPAPKAPAPTLDEDIPDLRDSDKPKNKIIRLPSHIVREKTSPVLRERDVNTKAGLAALAEQRYISDADRALNRWNIFGTRSTAGGNSTSARALAMYAEDERLKNMAELNDDAAIVSATDKAAGLYIKREAQQTFMRTSDFGWTGTSGREDRGANDAATAPR
jgi:hypothetical protein